MKEGWRIFVMTVNRWSRQASALAMGEPTVQVTTVNTETLSDGEESTMQRECENERTHQVLKHICAAIWGEKKKD